MRFKENEGKRARTQNRTCRRRFVKEDDHFCEWFFMDVPFSGTYQTCSTPNRLPLKTGVSFWFEENISGFENTLRKIHRRSALSEKLDSLLSRCPKGAPTSWMRRAVWVALHQAQTAGRWECISTNSCSQRAYPRSLKLHSFRTLSKLVPFPFGWLYWWWNTPATSSFYKESPEHKGTETITLLEDYMQARIVPFPRLVWQKEMRERGWQHNSIKQTVGNSMQQPLRSLQICWRTT